jgi:hypothetical protein
MSIQNINPKRVKVSKGITDLLTTHRLEGLTDPAAPAVTIIGAKGTPAAAEVASMQISGTVTTAGDISISLDGVATPVAVALDDTAVMVADKIRATAFSGWTTGGAAGTDTVTFTCDTTGPKADATFSVGTAAGVSATVTTNTQGKDDTRTVYDYFVVAEDLAGNTTLASPKGGVTDGYPTLDATNYNTVSWTAVDGAVKYYVLNTDTGTLLGTTSETSLNDTGQTTTAFTAPVRNNTADSVVEGRFQVKEGIGIGNSLVATTAGTIVRKMEVFDVSGNSLGFVPIYDSIS